MWPLEDIDIIRWSGWRAWSCKAASIWDGRCKDLAELSPLLPVSQLESSAIPTLPVGLAGLLQWLTDPREMGLSVSHQYLTNNAAKNKTATWWTTSVRSGVEKKPEHPSPLWVCHSPGSSTCSAIQRLSTLFSLGVWRLCYKDTIDFITCHWQFTYLSVFFKVMVLKILSFPSCFGLSKNNISQLETSRGFQPPTLPSACQRHSSLWRFQEYSELYGVIQCLAPTLLTPLMFNMWVY